MITVVLAWLAVLGLGAGALVVGRDVRTGRRPVGAERAGVVLTRSGPWTGLLFGVLFALLSGSWLLAAALAGAAVLLTAGVGLLLAPA